MKKISIFNINNYINWILGILKWPIAVLMLLLIVPAFQTDMALISHGTTSKILWEFFLPFGVTVLFFLIMPGLSGSFFVIAEHELTHMLFAVLTLHKPKALEFNQDEGGSFSFVGAGNWLIALAPYFFPTFTFFLLIGLQIYQGIYQTQPTFYYMILGIFIGYHFITTLFEIHPKQTDFIVAGPIFSICFIPTANLLVYGLLFAYLLKGGAGIPAYFHLLLQQIKLFLPF